MGYSQQGWWALFADISFCGKRSCSRYFTDLSAVLFPVSVQVASLLAQKGIQMVERHSLLILDTAFFRSSQVQVEVLPMPMQRAWPLYSSYAS